jgi:hypothetical protein
LRSFFLASEDVSDLLFQIRHLIRGIIPEDRVLDPKIDMRENIAEPGNLLPVGIRICSLEIVRQVLDCFPDNLEIPDNRIPAPAVRGEFIVRDPLRVLFDIADSFKDVIKVLEGRS